MRLEEYIKKEGYTYRKFGKITGINHNTLVKYNKGKNTPSFKNIFLIDVYTKGQVTVNDWFDLYVETNDLKEEKW